MQLLVGNFSHPFTLGQDESQVLSAALHQLKEIENILGWLLWPFLAGKDAHKPL